MRPTGRAADEIRSVSLERGASKHAEGSCLVRFGDTHVLCTASVEERLPPWLRGGGKGWVTAEYGMLPRSTGERMRREATQGKQSGRTLEIQRLIGRSLRAAIGLNDIAVDSDLTFAHGNTIHARPQRSANQALNFDGPAALPARCRLSPHPRRGRPWQHAVFSGDPAQPLVF